VCEGVFDGLSKVLMKRFSLNVGIREDEMS